MEIFDTSQLPPDGAGLSPSEIYWLYNGFDCCITNEIRLALRKNLDEVSGATYAQALRLQAPFLEMMLRGLLVNEAHRAARVRECEEQLALLEYKFNRLCAEGLELTYVLNWRSPLQVKALFYDILGLPKIRKRGANGAVLSVDREALEKLSSHFVGELFANFILAMRDLGKQIGFLKTPLDPDKRIRCNFNLAGTNTGRLSSSFSDFGTGTNLQNIDRNLRYIFIPDPGKVFVNVDLEQGDSRGVGALAWNMFLESHGPEFAGSYLDACESRDLHTFVCRMCWPELPWGDDPADWRAVAETVAYRTYTYRDLAKKLGHGSNYMGQPPAMSMHSKVPVGQIIDFQSGYFGTFPCIPAWQQETVRILRETGQLTHLLGRRRYFFGRHNDQSVLNAAIAYCPQGMTGDIINEGILRLWRNPQFELLVQVHDSILLQIDQDRIDELVPEILSTMLVQTELAGGRMFSIPCEAKVGWNWGDVSADNPHGMAKFKGSETRTPPNSTRLRRLSLKGLL